MLPIMEKPSTNSSTLQSDKKNQAPLIPAVALPKGGGAIRGIGEKFNINAVTGTSSLSIPLSMTPGRGGFTPQLSLEYNSGNGNSGCGYGWNIAVASISRKTAKGIPRYDASDVFIFSGIEDLVLCQQQQDGLWQPVSREENSFLVQWYRPRIEGPFTIIEKWEDKTTGDVHWKTVSKDNITSLYGLTNATRITDPSEPNRVFEWLIEETFDAKGNYVSYRYKKENAEGIDISLSSEGPRIKEQKSFNHVYLKSVHYGNTVAGNADNFHFHVVLDYGEHLASDPSMEEQQPWSVRKDPFSKFTSAFEIRQYRLCRRILLFHSFETLDDKPVLVRSMSLQYEESEKVSLLTSVQLNGYKRRKDGLIEVRSIPPTTFSYSKAVIGTELKSISPEQLKDLPYGVDGNTYQWLDLEGEGLPGIFTETADGWYYKHNRGEIGFSAPYLVREKPRPSLANQAQPVFNDIDADGSMELLLHDTALQGYFDQKETHWQEFVPYESYPNGVRKNPELKYIDLNGDGLADILISEDEAFVWYPSKGKKGFGPPEYVRKVLDEEKGPTLVFSDAENTVYLADMTGDGLNDILRIRNGEIAYWPNLGYGNFGARVLMENSPVFDAPDQFNQKRIRLFDIDGTGTTDIVYFTDDVAKVWYNCSGNGWSTAEVVTTFPTLDHRSSLAIVDLFGKGTGCLVWSTSLPVEASNQLRYLDLMSEGKPFLMSTVNNNMGKETLLQYTSSTEFYLDDLLHGTPWITKLHFPVHVLKQVTAIDHVSSSRLSTTYRYHHGYYDGEEREFRGFGMVEQTDSESFDTYIAENALDMPPILTKSWFHTGAYVNNYIFSAQFRSEYFDGDMHAHYFPDSIVEGASEMDYEHLREACRALKGKTLRQEVYAMDGSDQENIPYSVTETNFRIRQLQPRGGEKYAVYLSLENESIAYTYERNAEDPRIAHTFLLEADSYGHSLKSVQVAYPRRSFIADSLPEQGRLFVTAQTNAYLNTEDEFYLLGVVLEQKKFEIDGLDLAPDSCFTFVDMATQLEGVFDEDKLLLHHENFSSGAQARMISWVKNYFWRDEIAPLPFGEVSALALPHHSEQVVMSHDWVNAVYDTRVDDAMMEQAGYFNKDNHWWNPGTILYYQNASSFYLPFKTQDAFGNQLHVQYDQYSIAASHSEDALGNVVTAEIDYRTLSPSKIIDPNQNTSEAITDPLGLVIATSIYGTVNGQLKGDSPLSVYEEQQGVTIGAVITNPAAFLQEATTFFYYNLSAWVETQQPPHFINLLREAHVSELNGLEPLIQLQIGYSDGFGRELQSKAKVDNDINGNEQWLVTGRVVYNNKEKPVKKYEPFYSNTHAYQNEAEVAPVGVTPIMYYDPLGRVYKTETPKGFHSKVVFDPWRVSTYDENDTLKDSIYYAEHIGIPGDESEALRKAEAHYNTPSVAILDTLARQFMSMQYKTEGDFPLVTYTTFEIQGNPLTIADPRQYALNQSRTLPDHIHNFHYQYDLGGNNIYTNSIDAGEAWNLLNVLGNPVHAWNARGYHSTTLYDGLQRPTQVIVDGNELDQTVQRMEYGEDLPGAAEKNLRGQLVKSYDQAGVIENHFFDIHGKPLSTTRTLRTEYKTEVNWNDATSVDLESEGFTAEMEYDALGRIIKSLQPDGSISRPSYHQAGWLDKVEVQLKGEGTFTSFVESIEYNAKGQRTKIVYGNGVHTSYSYEETTFRLTNLLTTRQELDGSLTLLQDIRYVYDPVGNIVKITDYSHEKVFTANQIVNPESEYVYDALYQLKEATGREHMALSKTDYQDRSDIYKNVHFAGINDENQLRNYTELYTYDEAGNLTQLRHVGENSYTRDIQVSTTSNRAITDEMDTTADVENYFDEVGNMKQLEHIQSVAWNYRNNMSAVIIVERDSENDSEYYVYNGVGQRVRKIKETYDESGSLLWKEEKIYLGDVELRRKYQGSNQNLHEVRSALHVMDDQKRIAIVYYWETSSDSAVTVQENKIHYQLCNHLGSASMELNAAGQLISYEEYFPFGGTAFTTGSSAIEVALKEYRYSGKERDDATGLYYNGARYYASWVGRWLSADPAGAVDGLNLFAYVKNNPLRLLDPNGTKSEETFNAGEQIGMRRIDDVVYAEYKAKENTWISASAKEQGLDKFFSKDQAYGAYEGIVLDRNGNRWQNTDLVKPGQVYLIPVANQGDFTIEPALPSPVQEPTPTPTKDPSGSPPSSGWDPVKKATRFVIDTVFFDKVTIEGHIEGGGSGTWGVGLEGFTGPTLAGTIITNPVSPDFGKAAVNPAWQVVGGIKGGAKAEGGPKGGGGVSLTLGEYIGDSKNSTIKSLPGWSASGAIAVEGQAIGAAQLSVVGSHSPASLPAPLPGWIEGGADISFYGGPGTGISGEAAAGVKYTWPAWVEVDLLPAPLRSAHTSFIQSIY